LNPAYPNPSLSSAATVTADAAAVASDEILMMENGKSINDQELIDRIQDINEMVAKKQDNPVYHSVNEILSQEELPENLKNLNKDKSFIMKCILGLKTSPRRKINPKNLVKVYARIEAQKTRIVRFFLKNLGIQVN